MVDKEGIDLEDLQNMPKPKVYYAFSFHFINDFNKEEVEIAIHKKCTRCVLTKDAKISPITNKKSGYMYYKMGIVDDFFGEKYVEEIVNYLYNYKKEIIELNKKYDGSITINICFYLTSFNTPCIHLTNNIIKKMAELNIDFDEGVSYYSHLEFKNIITSIEYEE